MPKNKFNREAYLQMLQEKLGGTKGTSSKDNDLTSIAQRLRQTIPKHRELPRLR